MAREPNLGPRLRAIAERVPADDSVADLGCDHALLSASLVLTSRAMGRRVIAADIAPGALAFARATRARFALGDRLEIRRGDGVSVLAPGEVSCIVIAGVGGPTMLHMLGLDAEGDTDPLADLGITRLVLQAQAAVGTVRRTLDGQGWAFADECLVRESGRIYGIIAATRPGPETRGLSDDLDAEFGPWIRHRPDPLFRDQLEAESARVEYLIRRLRAHGAPGSRVAAFETRLARMHAERRRLEPPGGDS